MADQNTLRMGLDVKFNTNGQCCGASLFALEEVVVPVQILAGPHAGFFSFLFFFFHRICFHLFWPSLSSRDLCKNVFLA